MIRLVPLGLLAAALPAAADPRQEFSRGVLEEARGNTPAANARFESALREDPLALPLVRRVATARLAAGDRTGVEQLYTALAENRPDSLEAQLQLIDFLNPSARDRESASPKRLAALERARSHFPANPEILSRLFHLYLERGRRADALAALDSLSGRDPSSALAFATLARTAFAAGDTASRQRIDRRFREAMEAHPESAPLARAASDHFRNQDDLDGAVEMLRRHAAAAPGSLTLRTRLGVLLFSAGRDAEGTAALDEVLAIDPNQAAALQAMAKFHTLRGDAAEARAFTARRLKAHGGPPADFLAVADTMLGEDQPRDARLLLEKAVFDQPDHLELAMKLAIATGRDPSAADQASRRFREAEALMPDPLAADPDFLVASARALIASRQGRSAEERLRAAIRSYPPANKAGTASALRVLANLWRSESRNAEAAKSLLQRADSLDR